MSPLDAIARQLAQLIEADNTPEYRALVEILENRLYHLLAVPPLPPEVGQHFGNPFTPGTPLLTWCQNHLPSETSYRPLHAVAALLDALAESDTPLLVFVPTWFRVDAQERVLVFLPQLALAMRQPGQTHFDDRQCRSYARLTPPPLLKTLDHIDPRAVLLYSFALFLIHLFLGLRTDSKSALLSDLRRCRHRDRALPPELPELFYGLLTQPLDQAPECSCRELALLVLDHVRDNPLVCRPALNRACEHEVFAYSVFGLNKAEPANEDRVLCRSEGAVSFGLVADGVSTVDIGRGELAAEEIARVFRLRFQARFDDLAIALAEQIQADPAADWKGPAELLLRDLFREANQRVAALANALWDSQSEVVPVLPRVPPCSTLTAALVVFDQALLAFVGDSPALLFRQTTGRLSKLTTEDHLGLEEDFDPESGLDPNALTRVIGMSSFDEEKRVFEASELPVPVVRVQLQPGDLLLLGSDGLLECIDEPTPMDRFSWLESVLQRLHLTDVPLKNLVQQLVRLGEDGRSDDNISVTATRIRGAMLHEDSGLTSREPANGSTTEGNG